MRGTSQSIIAWMNGSAVARISSASGGGSEFVASRRSAATFSARTSPGPSDTSRIFPSASVISASNAGPAGTFRYHSQLM